MTARMWEAITALVAERRRQHEIWGDQSALPDGTGPAGGHISGDVVEQARRLCQAATADGTVTWADVLTEEYYEALAETDPARLRGELVQVAAVCLAWVEAIDARAQREEGAA